MRGFEAMYRSECGECGGPINEGDMIVKDEFGDYTHTECADEPGETDMDEVFG
jgi:hypothetical protein